MLRLFIASILFLFHAHVWASEPGVFLNPPTGGPIHNYTRNPEYKLGETVQLRWATNLDSFSIILWQNDNSEYETVQTNLKDSTTYNWIVSTQRDLKDGNVFFFQIVDDTDNSNLFASHYFNITDDDGTTATATSSSSSTASPTPISSLFPSATTSTAASSSDSSSETGGLPPQAKVGIGVGVGLGGAFFIAIAGTIWYFGRRAQRTGGSSDVVPAGAPMTDSQMSSSYGLYELPAKEPASGPHYPVEVSAENERHELPS